MNGKIYENNLGLMFDTLIISDDHTLCERLKRAQNLSFDDQRGLAPQDLELPEFLRESGKGSQDIVGRESAPAALTRSRGQPQTLLHSVPDSEILATEEYVENHQENFVEFSRELPFERYSTPFVRTKVPKRPSRRGRQNRFNESVLCDDRLQSSDQSFSQDGVLPFEEDADRLFQSSVQESPDFNDPYLTDKSLKDIGFNYHYNKYLSKSRNFINYRPRNIQSNSFLGPEWSSSSEYSSPNQTIRGETVDMADYLDSTLVHSPHSSPYSSDSCSSLDKENLGKFKWKKNVQKSSRHTLIHSPVTAMDDDVLSAVDTDGRVLHSTPKSGVKLINAGNTPKVLGAVQTSQDPRINYNHTDAVTFV